jgi:thioredoxin-related protein
MVSMKSNPMQKQSRISLVLLIILCSVSITLAENQQKQESVTAKNPKWSVSYQDSLEKAQLEKKPVLIKFEASWCVWCEKMEKEVFTEPDIIKELDKFVCVKIDVDKQENIAKAYKIKSLPRTIVINTNNEIVGDWLGFHEAPVFSKLLRDVDEYTHVQTGTTKAPQIQEEAGTSAEAQNIPEIKTNDTSELIGLLGHKNSGVNRKVIALLVKTGPQILPKVVPALESSYLGTRIAAWKVIYELTGNKYNYDPWASISERTQAAEIIKEKLSVSSK